MTTSPAPVRLRLSRAPGFNLQEASRGINGLPAIHVARPTIFGNPWRIEDAKRHGFKGTDEELAAMCVSFFRNNLVARLPRTATIRANMGSLVGHNLACWCKLDSPCHGDVLLEFAASYQCEEA